MTRLVESKSDIWRFSLRVRLGVDYTVKRVGPSDNLILLSRTVLSIPSGQSWSRRPAARFISLYELLAEPAAYAAGGQE